MSSAVDIIIPNYNKAKYLEDAIKSVLGQKYTNWSLYIIDDNSKDGSVKILEKFRDNSKITIVLLKKNKGPSFCRNLGMRISSSEYISFLDSDDMWKKEKLSKQIDFMKKNKFEFSFTDYEIFFENTNGKKIFIKPTNIENVIDYSKFIHNSSINSSTMILKRSSIKNLKFKRINKLEDYLFKCELLKKGVLANKSQDVSAYYRVLRSSRSSQRLKNLFFLWKINKKYNKLNFFSNLLSLFMISINSLKKYGLK